MEQNLTLFFILFDFLFMFCHFCMSEIGSPRNDLITQFGVDVVEQRTPNLGYFH